MAEISCDVALKEWAVTGEALSQGRQIVLLRKGGLLDEDGSFSLEYSQFFLLPTSLHQEEALVKPQHRDLFGAVKKMADESLQVAYFRHFARVAAVWRLGEGDQARLEAAPHIWSRSYLDVRFGYKPEKPLLCAALRVWELQSPLRNQMRPQDMGCRSWVEMAAPLVCAATPVLDDAAFGASLDKLRQIFG